MAGLSVIIPTLNEAKHLPLLLADLLRWKDPLEILVIDGGSNDATKLIARINGVNCYQSLKQGRGYQLNLGVTLATNAWFLILHADSRLDQDWYKSVKKLQIHNNSDKIAWFFDFKVDKKNIMFTILEIAVSLRSHFFQLPYGDQGLLLHRNLYKLAGGYKNIAIMEDLEIVKQIKTCSKLKSIGISITTSSRRWVKKGILERAWQNALLRRRWSRGESTTKLAKDYRS